MARPHGIIWFHLLRVQPHVMFTVAAGYRCAPCVEISRIRRNTPISGQGIKHFSEIWGGGLSPFNPPHKYAPVVQFPLRIKPGRSRIHVRLVNCARTSVKTGCIIIKTCSPRSNF